MACADLTELLARVLCFGVQIRTKKGDYFSANFYGRVELCLSLFCQFCVANKKLGLGLWVWCLWEKLLRNFGPCFGVCQVLVNKVKPLNNILIKLSFCLNLHCISFIISRSNLKTPYLNGSPKFLRSLVNQLSSLFSKRTKKTCNKTLKKLDQFL